MSAEQDGREGTEKLRYDFSDHSRETSSDREEAHRPPPASFLRGMFAEGTLCPDTGYPPSAPQLYIYVIHEPKA